MFEENEKERDKDQLKVSKKTLSLDFLFDFDPLGSPMEEEIGTTLSIDNRPHGFWRNFDYDPSLASQILKAPHRSDFCFHMAYLA